jgi:serine/threonine protein kinase
LGKGSFGEVRQCTNKITGMKMAIKIVTKNSIAQHQVLIDLMESELDVLSKTDHPGIVRVLELLEDDINFYIVSELVNNGELYDYIIQNKMFNEQTAA